MSVSVLFQGRRKAFKLRPMDPMQRLLEQAAQEFGVDATSCTLAYKKATIDLAQPFRFTNISNNATVDLVPTNTRGSQESSSSSSNTTQSVRVGVSLPTGGSVTSIVPASLTLMSTLEVFVAEGHIPSSVLHNPSTELVYFRQSFTGEALAQTTLQSLGLGGTSAKFSLRVQLDEGVGEEKGSSVPIQDTPAPLPLEGNPPAGNIVQQRVSERTVEEIAAPNSNPNPEPPRQTTAELSTDTTVNTSEYITPNIEGCRVALQFLLTRHFTADVTETVLILMRILCNILNQPDEDKYRRLRYSNSLMSQKVLPRAGASAFLQCAGFVVSHGSALSYEIARNPHQHTYLVFDWNGHASHTPEQLMTLLRQAYDACVFVCDELQVPIEDRPAPKPLANANARQTPVEFDPYRSNVFRATADGPRKVLEPVGPSITEQRLNDLKMKKKQLEGDVSSIAANRELQIVAPPQTQTEAHTYTPSDTSIPEAEPGFDLNPTLDPDTNPETNPGPDAKPDVAPSAIAEEADPEDRRMYARYLALTLARAQSSFEAPLKTRAVRELERLESARAYTHTRLKLQMPDRWCVCASFHPSETLTEIRALLLTCLNAELGLDVNTCTFFTSPPKTVLPEDRSLDEMGLVPAAIVYISFPEKPVGDVRYLSEAVQATAEQQMETGPSYPTAMVVEPRPANSNPTPSLNTDRSSASRESKGEGKKPKWLKI